MSRHRRNDDDSIDNYDNNNDDDNDDNDNDSDGNVTTIQWGNYDYATIAATSKS